MEFIATLHHCAIHYPSNKSHSSSSLIWAHIVCVATFKPIILRISTFLNLLSFHPKKLETTESFLPKMSAGQQIWFTHKENMMEIMIDEFTKKQGWIHGNLLRRGGQGRKCAFSHFSTRSLRTGGRTDKASYRVACPQLKTGANGILEEGKRRSF